MPFLLENAGGLWILAGALLVLAEAWFIGVGFLFAGFGALFTGMAIHFGVIAPDNVALQVAVFFLATGGFAALLWKKLKAFRQGKSNYSNMVGDAAVVESAVLEKHATGKIKWSGTHLDARLSADAKVESVASGSEVIIHKIEGNTAYCKPAKE